MVFATCPRYVQSRVRSSASFIVWVLTGDIGFYRLMNLLAVVETAAVVAQMP